MIPVNYKVLDCDFDWSIMTPTNTDYINTVLVIRCDFSPGVNVSFPPGVTLLFEGGSFSDVILTGNNTKIESPLTRIFDTSVTLNGMFVYDTFYPEWYGAVGNADTNDFAAMNAACTNANHVTLTQKYRIYVAISSTDPNPGIKIEKENFTLVGYNSVITDAVMYTPNDPSDPDYNPLIMSYPIFTFKNVDNLVVEGVTIDGNKRISKGITLDNVAKGTLRDITVSNLQNNIAGRNSIGLEIFVIDGSKIHGDNIRISEIGGGQDNTIDEGVGIGRATYINLDNNIEGLTERGIKAVTQKTKITFDNSFFEWVYGDDGDVIDIIDQNYISDAPSGGVNFRNADPGNFPDFRNMHGKMINCEYRNTGNLNIGSGHTLIAAYTNGVEIRGNRFYDMYVTFKNKTSNFIVDNNHFYNANIETNLIRNTVDSSLNEWEDGICYITNNYGYYAPITSTHFALINVKNDLISVTIRNNKVFSEEGSVNVGFYGLLRHTRVSGTSNAIVAVDVNISNNEIIRRNSIRNEYLIVDDTVGMDLSWKLRCSLFDNFLNKVGPVGVGAKFNSGTIPPSFYWNNRDGEGNVIGII